MSAAVYNGPAFEGAHPMAEVHDTLTQEAVRYGLTNLTAQHLAQFNKAREAAARFVSSLPRDLPVTAEPAHTFRASQEA
jgi:hypothetical protein